MSPPRKQGSSPLYQRLLNPSKRKASAAHLGSEQKIKKPRIFISKVETTYHASYKSTIPTTVKRNQAVKQSGKLFSKESRTDTKKIITNKTEVKIDSTVNTFLLKKIQQTIDSKDYSIPNVWPRYDKQRGHCCGLYALATGLKYAHPNLITPPARKDGIPGRISLRQRAKALRFTSFGEIFDVHSLSRLAATFGFKNCMSLASQYRSKMEYVDKICSFLKKGGSVIVACDLGENNYPGMSSGIHTHWALIYGYYFSKGECHFLTYQYGRNYLWTAENLFQSNHHLPELNPKRPSCYFYYKDKSCNLELFQERSGVLNHLKPKRYVIGETLKNFRFGLCHIPSSIKVTLMDLSTQIANNIISASISPSIRNRRS